MKRLHKIAVSTGRLEELQLYAHQITDLFGELPDGYIVGDAVRDVLRLGNPADLDVITSVPTGELKIPLAPCNIELNYFGDPRIQRDPTLLDIDIWTAELESVANHTLSINQCAYCLKTGDVWVTEAFEESLILNKCWVAGPMLPEHPLHHRLARAAELGFVVVDPPDDWLASLADSEAPK